LTTAVGEVGISMPATTPTAVTTDPPHHAMPTDPSREADAAGRSGRAFRLIAFALVLAGLLAASLLLPVRDWLEAFLSWTAEVGPAGPLVLGLFYVVATVLLLPGSILTLGAGFAFGLPVGFVTVSLASTTGATCAFLVGRWLARDAVARRLEGRPKFRAVEQAVGREGFKIVLLLRLSPIFPFNLLNYGLGLTSVRLKDYVLASWIGMIPGTLLYVYLGAAARDVAALVAGEVEGAGLRQILLGVGLLATVAVVVLVTRTARRALDAALEGGESGATEPSPGETKP
jgi:uncharacterized membrane protein YdjX (TVP38/TMEM64 family)